MFYIKGENKVIRTLILFFILSLLFDGVFRKWFLAPLSAPLMMIKQILAIIICLKSITVFPIMSLWEKSFALIGLIAFITTLLFGHQNIMVALYGCIPFWFGLPIYNISYYHLYRHFKLNLNDYSIQCFSFSHLKFYRRGRKCRNCKYGSFRNGWNVSPFRVICT